MSPVRSFLMAYLGASTWAVETPTPVDYRSLASFLADFTSDASLVNILVFIDDGRLPTGVLKEMNFPLATLELKRPPQTRVEGYFWRLSAPRDFKVLLFNVDYSLYSRFLFYYSALQVSVNLLCGVWYPEAISIGSATFRFPLNASCCQSLFVQSIAQVGSPENHLNSSLMVTNLNGYIKQNIDVTVSLNREFETVCVHCGLIRPNSNSPAFEYLTGYEGRNMIALFVHNMVHFAPEFNGELHRWEPVHGTEAYMADYFEKFLNVSLEFRRMEEFSYGKIEDHGSSSYWNGVIGMVYNKSADIAYGEMSMNYNRSKAVQFTAPYTVEVVSFMTKRPSLLPGYQALWWPFDTLTWIIVCSSAAACVITLRLFRTSRMANDSRKFSFPTAWPDWSMVVGMILRQPGENFYHPTQLNYRLFLIIMWIYTIVITTIYCSAFTSMMSLPVYQEGIDNIADLGRAAIQNRIRCSALVDSVMLQCITEHNGQPGLAALAKRVAEDPSLIAKDRLEVVTRKHESDFCFVDMANYLRKAMENLDISEAVTSQDSFLTSPSSYALQKKCYIVEKYSAAVRAMVDFGLVALYLQRALYGNKTQTKEGASASPLMVENVKGHFMILIIGLSSIMLIEVLRTTIRFSFLQRRPRKRKNAAATMDYAVQLMDERNYYLVHTKISEGSHSAPRALGRVVYNTGSRRSRLTKTGSAKNPFISVSKK